MLWDYNPWEEMERMRREIDGVFGRYGRTDEGSSFPLTNIYDTPDGFTVTAELPGLKKDDVKITLEPGLLSLSGRRPALEIAKGAAIIRQERATGEFEKTFRIPGKVVENKTRADFVNGILTITLPKSEEAKPKQIAIEVK